jgi:hypothetical protein
MGGEQHRRGGAAASSSLTLAVPTDAACSRRSPSGALPPQLPTHRWNVTNSRGRPRRPTWTLGRVPRCRHRCRRRPALAIGAQSRANGIEEGLALLRREIVDHQLLGRRERPHAAKELLDRKLEVLTARRGYGVDRHLGTNGTGRRPSCHCPPPCPLRALFDRESWSSSGRGGQQIWHLTRDFARSALVTKPADRALQAGGRGFESHQLHSEIPCAASDLGRRAARRRPQRSPNQRKLAGFLGAVQQSRAPGEAASQDRVDSSRLVDRGAGDVA